MARHPIPGRVKTRLARALGPETACALYRAFVLDLADRLRVLPWRVTWAYEPASAPFPALLPGARCRAQEGGDLGARMAAAVAAEFADGAPSVVVLGADVPHIPRMRIEGAVRALSDVDVVLGPAEDGGYYLIGVRRPLPELFRGIAWGTAEVLATTRARAAAAGLQVRLLPVTFDVDEPADISRLRALLARGEVDLPRTAALVDSLSAHGS
jgi:rSAM/selenodomain-associated transferase 1